MSAPRINWDFRVRGDALTAAPLEAERRIWVTAISRVHPYQTEPMKAKQTAATCYPQDLCLGKVLPCRAPRLSHAAGIPHSPRSHRTLLGGSRRQPKHTGVTPSSSQLWDSARNAEGTPAGIPMSSPAGLSSSNKLVINCLTLQNRLRIHCLRTKASGVNLSKRWAMDSDPGSSTLNLLSPLQLFIIPEAFSERGILPTSHYHNLNNLQCNLFHDRVWSGLPFPQAF